MTLIISFLVCVGGAVIFYASKNERLRELARYAYIFGLFFMLLIILQLFPVIDSLKLNFLK